MPNESAKIILAVTNGKLSKVRDALAVEGTINALKCGFQFRTQDWDGTTKTAVFVRGRATPSTTNADITYVILDENNECDVPAEILEKDGMFSVGVFGESENYRIVSNWMCYKIANGCYADGSTPVDPGSSAYNQLIKMIKSKSDIGHNHADLYYTKDESEDRFVSQEELIGMMATPDWNQNDETANDYIKNKPTIPTTLAELSDDDAHRTVTDIEKSEWNKKATTEEVDSKIASIKPLIITVTQNDAGDYIADKTFVEISTAIKSGQTAILLEATADTFFPFIYLDENSLEFGCSDVYDDEAYGEYYFIDDDDSIECISSRLNKIPNPNPLNFTGAVSATYDGSNTVNVNIPQGVTNEEVDSKIAALVNSAPETLDTLNELAEALGNDPNFATTIATQLGNKVDKVDGKGLSTNDYTDEDKDKLSNISPSDWNQSNEMSSDYIKNKPTKLSQFVNDSGFLTEHQSLVDYAKKTEIPTVPTKVSELQNDKNYTPISLGITGATKETYLQIAAVDSEGRPTAFDTMDSWEDIDSYIARNFGNTQNNMVGDVLVISAINGENQVTSIRNLHVLSEYVAESSSEQNGYLITNAVMKAAIADVLRKLSEAVEANTAARHTHDNKAVLDSITGIVTPASNPIQKTDIVQYQVFKDVTDGIIEAIPTKVSELENDSMFTTSDDISSITPSIGDNGNWFVGSVDTGVVAKGADGKGIKNISIGHIVEDGLVTDKKCLTVIYSDDTKTEIQLPEIFNKDISIYEIDNGVGISYLDGNTFSTYNITNGRGIVSIDKTSTSGLVDTYTITYTDNTTSTFNVTNSVTKSEIEKLSGEVDTLKEAVGITTVSEENFSGLSSVEIDNLNEQSIDVELSTDNLILMPYDNNFLNTTPSTDTVASANGVNFRANSDGSIDVWGTATKNTIYNMRNYHSNTKKTSRLTVDPGIYTIGLTTSELPLDFDSSCIRISTSLYTVTAIYKGYPATFSVSESKLHTLNLQITTGFKNIDESNPIRVYPMFNLGSELKPYTCPKIKSINVSETPSFPDVTLTVRKNDSNLSQVVVSGGALASINTSGATKVKLETDLPFIISVSNIRISQNNKDALNQRFAIITSASVGTSPKSIIRQTLSDGESIELEETMAKKNKQLVFFAKVNTMGTLYIYHGENLYNSGWIQIDDTNLRVYTYDSTSHLRKEIEHGLTIKNYLGIVANTGNKNNLSIRVITDGGEFTVDDIYWSSSNGIIKAVSDGCSFTSVGMSWNCNDFKKKIWMYGDSYFDFQNAARWPYYMVQWGFDNCAAFGFPGAKSVDVYPEWQRTLQHGTPKYAIWCLGMNDVDSDTEINTEWKTYVDKFIEDCTSIGIEPILATIPNTPNRRHTYKNDYVKSSNRRYIDFADAVNASEYPASWFDGMLHTDNTHPLKEGAVALAIRAITDIPELVQQ